MATSPSAPASEAAAYTPRYIDIGINLTDSMYQGTYHHKAAHQPDLPDVISRATAVGVKKMLVTGSDLVHSVEAIKIARENPGLCFATVGVHPCSAKGCGETDEEVDKYFEEVERVAREGKEEGTVMAFGEFGLDYDRLHYADTETQLKIFQRQLDLAKKLNLPLFLHSRACAPDFFRLLSPILPHIPGGLVHSFTGTLSEMRELVDAGLYIGLNGCSMKTAENLEVVKEVPLERIMIETDGPWCEIRKSHAGWKVLEEGGYPDLGVVKKKERWERGVRVNGRNEPVAIQWVALVVARVKGITLEEVCEAAWKNSIELFGLGEKK